jgi:hypothetical protein
LIPPLFFVGWTYYHAVVPIPRPIADYPVPNAYDGFRELAPRWENVSFPYDDDSTEEERREFLRVHADDLRQIRRVVADRGVVVLRYDNHWSDDGNAFRRLAQSLELLSRGKPASERAEIGRDMLRQAVRLSHGGTGVHVILRAVAIRLGAEVLYGTPQLSVEQCRALCEELRQLDDERESIAVVVDRDFAWTMNTDDNRRDWSVRVEWAVTPFSADALFPEHWAVLRRVDSMSAALLRLLRVELALQAWRKEHSGWPDSLDALTPDYLDAVPRDPFSDGSLVYRVTGDAYLLYSLGPDREDDGGRPGNLTDVMISGVADLSLEMLVENRQADDAP